MAEDGEDFEWSAAGVYEYTHDGEHWVGDPYTRYVRPGTPLKVDELPKEVADKISAVRFPIAFSETPRFQPMEYVDCTTWGAAWETLDGELRAVPGRESEFEKEYPDHARHAREGAATTYRTAPTSRRPRADHARDAKLGLLVNCAMIAVAIAIVCWLMRSISGHDCRNAEAAHPAPRSRVLPPHICYD